MSDRPYETGYGKPPKHRRFQKGQSGNPKGRPKGSKNFATIFHEVGRQKIKVTENGVTREITKFEASSTQLLNKAAAGDMRALNTMIPWVRLFQEAVEDSDKPTQFNGEDDQKVMESILKRFQEIHPQQKRDAE
jgi:hypothetical protein